MKTPPLLLGAALLFWGWQAGFLAAGAVMAVLLEGSRFVKTRWEVSDEDFSRIWIFCSVLFLAAVVYAFTANEGPSIVSLLIQHPKLAAQSGAAMASARTATSLFRWLPMIFFLFVAAQTYSTREEVPWTTISQILRRRWRKARRLGWPMPAARGVSVGFPYFALCLFAASSHGSENSLFFCGLCVLLGWALWSQRSRRFGIPAWLAAFALAAALGYGGQRGMSQLQSYITTFNLELISRFIRRDADPDRSSTALGQIGRLKNSSRIVIRLKPKIGGAPTYLREATYRVFRSPSWFSSARPVDFKDVIVLTNGTTAVLLPGKTNSGRVEVACYIEGRNRDNGEARGLFPLPTGCGRLENLPAFGFTVKTNNAGAVLAEGPGLAIFDACYGPGATIDSMPDTNQDCSIPPVEDFALDQVVSELQLRGKSPAQAQQIINGFFQDKFSYSTWQGRPRLSGPNETPLSRFLLSTRSGHCEYFATATVLLLRKLDIPTRYAVGYAVHEVSGKGYVVRLRDAHAWCLVWDRQTRTWQDFDTTPASWVNEESKRASPWQRLSDLFSWLGFQFSKFRWGQTHLRAYLLYLLAPVLVLMLYRILFRGKHRQKPGAAPGTDALAARPGLDSEFYLIEKRLAARGDLRRPNEPLSDWLRRVTAGPGLAGASAPLQALLRLHYRYRFDPRSLNLLDREELRRGAAALLRVLDGRN